MKRLFLALAMLAAFGGCTMIESPSQDPAKMSESLQYFKDKHGICYAAMASVTYNSFRSISITAVPCDKVKLQGSVTNISD